MRSLQSLPNSHLKRYALFSQLNTPDISHKFETKLISSSVKLLHLNRKEDWSVPRKWRKWGSAIMKRTMSRTRIRTEKCPWMTKKSNELSDNTSIAVSKAMSVARLEHLVWIHSDLGKSEGSVDLWYNCSNALYSYCGTSHRPEHSNYSLTAQLTIQYCAFSALLT